MKYFTVCCFIFLLLGCGSSDKSEKIEDNTTEPIINPNNPLEVEKGKKLFLTNCATCHGSDAKGKTGPNVVGITQEDISDEIDGNSAMTFLQGKLTEDEYRLMSVYLDELKRLGGGEEEKFQKEKEALGDLLFHDTILSKNRTLTCASCHNPEHGYIDNRYDTNPIKGALSVGDDEQTLGGRNAPTLAYAKYIPDFLKIEDNTYLGGLFWDGRAKNLKEQAKGPILDHSEMMMPDDASVVERVKENNHYAQSFKNFYGDDIFKDTNKAYDAIVEVIAKYENTHEFSPLDSKYDRSKLPSYHVDHYEMTEEEKYGYKLFFSEETHCAKCHTTSSGTESSFETFTNYRYENIGIPKNIEALMKRDANIYHVDLGLGGRTDVNDKKQYGKFRVPTLRNIAVTNPYMSNGIFKELKTVLHYFNYMAGHGALLNPETGKSWQNAEVSETINHEILKTLKPLDDEKIEALESFLKLLTDKAYEGLL